MQLCSLCVVTVVAALSARSRPPRATSAAYATSVFIEDTDAFAVAYYATYLKWVERAAADWIGVASIGSLFNQRRLHLAVEHLDGVRYASPARLGDDLAVRLEPLSFASGALGLRADISRASDGASLWSCKQLRVRFYSESGACVEWPLPAVERLPASEASSAFKAAPSELPQEGASQPRRVRLHADEASPLGSLSLHAALRYFERDRSGAIGGPGALAALQEQGLHVVVARIVSAELLPASHNVSVGSELELRRSVVVRARDTQVVFEQWLVCGGACVARATVLCLCVDAGGSRIVSAPRFLVERLLQLK